MKNCWEIILKFWNKLTLTAKIVAILWTLNAIYMLFSGINFFQWLITWLFGYIMLVGITQLISNRKRSKSAGHKALAHTDALPIVMESNLLLSQGEVCHYSGAATHVKTKNVVVGYSGGSRGTSIRIAKGMSVRLGAHKAAPVRGDVQERTSGVLSITNKRVVFSGNKGAFDKKITALSAVTPYQNCIAFQFGNQQYPLETSEPEYVYEILARIINSSEDF